MPRRYRARRKDSSEREESPTQEEQVADDVGMKLEAAKELQKFRKRPGGVSAVGLAFGKKYSEEEKMTSDPFKLKTGGGLVDLKEMQENEAEKAEDEVLARLASTFSAETKQRDDDTHMLQYIENEMEKRLPQKEDTSEQESTYEAKVKSLYKLPERIDVKSKSKTEDMLSNQMLSGIPEIDLGLDAKFRNIEETELAKQKLVEDKMKQSQQSVSLAPSNMATNYTLHSLRFFKKDDCGRRKDDSSKEPVEAPPTYIPVVGESGPELKAVGQDLGKRKTDAQATDDFHYDKYRKKVRR
ncbi:splicing factor C9orf78-like [Halichondria panicea]|uniref:splicing factor C9orf78-like n=1 Tax=Halichondria panicea TaxID=6063 RepID=UPI00312B4E44